MKRIVHGQEFDRVRNNIIVSGLPLHLDAKERESQEQTKEVVMAMFSDIGLDRKDAKIDNCF